MKLDSDDAAQKLREAHSLISAARTLLQPRLPTHEHVRFAQMERDIAHFESIAVNEVSKDIHDRRSALGDEDRSSAAA